MRGLRAGGGEMRFSLWLARNHARGRRWGAALGAPLDVARRGVLDFASSAASSAFVRDARSEVDAAGVTLVGGLALRDGTDVPGARLERRFELDGRGLVVRERLLAPGDASDVRFTWPAAAIERREQHGASHEIAYRLA